MSGENQPTLQSSRRVSGALFAASFVLVSCLTYYPILKMETIFLPKRRFTFTVLYGVISEKMHLFIVTAVRTSNPIKTRRNMSGEKRN
jgi:hypothetical protein